MFPQNIYFQPGPDCSARFPHLRWWNIHLLKWYFDLGSHPDLYHTKKEKKCSFHTQASEPRLTGKPVSFWIMALANFQEEPGCHVLQYFTYHLPWVLRYSCCPLVMSRPLNPTETWPTQATSTTAKLSQCRRLLWVISQSNWRPWPREL